MHLDHQYVLSLLLSVQEPDPFYSVIYYIKIGSRLPWHAVSHPSQGSGRVLNLILIK